MQWEYASEEITIATYLQNPMERGIEAFNEMGEEEWELVSTVSTFDAAGNMERVFGIFKRPKGVS